MEPQTVRALTHVRLIELLKAKSLHRHLYPWYFQPLVYHEHSLIPLNARCG